MTSQLRWVIRCCFILTAITINATHSTSLQADILNWETGEVIPGTHGLDPVARGNFAQRNTSESNLRFADFRDQHLPESLFRFSDLTNARFDHADVSSAEFFGASLSGTNVSMALIAQADLERATENGFTSEQLYSTASYQTGELQRINFSRNDLGSWVFDNQQLTEADFTEANLAGTSFNNALVPQAIFDRTTDSGFTSQQLYSTASYASGELPSISLAENSMNGWTFAGQNLTQANFKNADLGESDFTQARLESASFIGASLVNANLSNSDLTSTRFSDARDAADVSGTDFTNAVVAGATFDRVVGLSQDQLYSTASYQSGVLDRTKVSELEMNGWDFGGQSLQSASFELASLRDAQFTNADLSKALMSGSNLMAADFTGANLTDVQFSGFHSTASLDSAILDDATINGALFREAFANGLTQAQLYSTASYKNRDLSRVDLSKNDLSSLNLAEQDLTAAEFVGSNLANVDFTNAVVTDGRFDRVLNFTKEQLYSTASYQAGDLGAFFLTRVDLNGWNLSGQDLEQSVFIGSDFEAADLRNSNLTGSRLQTASLQNANLSNSNFTRANFTGANLTDANFTDAIISTSTLDRATANGLTAEQFYSTASYKARRLQNISLRSNDFRGWNFVRQVLSDADFQGANLQNADFTDALVNSTSFTRTTDTGFAAEQLYSTASYKSGDLTRIKLFANDLRAWNFAGQNLSEADLRANLTGAIFRDANLSAAELNGATLTDADFREANVTHAQLERTVAHGFTPEQLYSTASYQDRDLTGIQLSENDLSGWSLRNQNLAESVLIRANLSGADLQAALLTGSDLRGATFTGADLSFSDLRRARTSTGDRLVAGSLRNAILPSGRMNGAHIEAGEVLSIRNDTVSILVQEEFRLDANATLQLQLKDEFWSSAFRFGPDVVPTLDGVLELIPEQGTDLDQMVGKQYPLFRWPVDGDGQLREIVGEFDEIRSGLEWDLSNLYTTGIVELLSAEPKLLGDFDLDGIYTGSDIDALSALVLGKENIYAPQLNFDLNNDGTIDSTDREFWVQELAMTNPGDLDLDGDVQFGDFLRLARSFGTKSGWADGDIDGSGTVDFADFLLLSRNFGASRNATVASIPEPTNFKLAFVVIALLFRSHERRRAETLAV